MPASEWIWPESRSRKPGRQPDPDPENTGSITRLIAAPPRAAGRGEEVAEEGFIVGSGGGGGSGGGKKSFFSDQHNDFIKSPPPPREKAKSSVAVVRGCEHTPPCLCTNVLFESRF